MERDRGRGVAHLPRGDGDRCTVQRWRSASLVDCVWLGALPIQGVHAARQTGSKPRVCLFVCCVLFHNPRRTTTQTSTVPLTMRPQKCAMASITTRFANIGLSRRPPSSYEVIEVEWSRMNTRRWRRTHAVAVVLAVVAAVVVAAVVAVVVVPAVVAVVVLAVVAAVVAVVLGVGVGVGVSGLVWVGVSVVDACVVAAAVVAVVVVELAHVQLHRVRPEKSRLR